MEALRDPAAFQCPITHETPPDPVVATDGQIYSLAAIDAWLETDGTSPVTRAPMTRRYMRPPLLVAVHRAFCELHGLPCEDLAVGVIDRTTSGDPRAGRYGDGGDTSSDEDDEDDEPELSPALVQRILYTRLHGAACRGDTSALETMIDEGADINVPWEVTGYDTPLVVSVRYRHVDTVRMLLLRGANPRLGNPVTLSIGGPPVITKMLLDAGADVHEKWRSRVGRTDAPLYRAVSMGLPDAVDLLLSHGADIFAHESNILTYAIVEGDTVDVLRVLEEYGADVERQKDRLVVLAVNYNAPDIARWLFERGASLGRDEREVICDVVKAGDSPMFHVLKEHYAAIDEESVFNYYVDQFAK